MGTRGYRVKVVKRPLTPPKEEHCSLCKLTKAYLEKRRDTYECSRIECPCRKPLTAGSTP